MPAVSQGADGPSDQWTVERALLLLEQTLEIIDHWADHPAIGARLQEVIEAIQHLDAPSRAPSPD
jgi:hypothetical protein